MCSCATSTMPGLPLNMITFAEGAIQPKDSLKSYISVASVGGFDKRMEKFLRLGRGEEKVFLKFSGKMRACTIHNKQIERRKPSIHKE